MPLTPRQRLVAVPYARLAAAVEDGGVTGSMLSDDALSRTGWENASPGEVILSDLTNEVHIGVNWRGTIGDKVWIRASDTNQHPLRVQIAPGLTKFRVTNNGGAVLGTPNTVVADNSLRVVQGQTIGVSTHDARLAVENSEGEDKDTMIHVTQNSSLGTGVHYGVRVDNSPSTSSLSYGYYHQQNDGTDATRYGYRNSMIGGMGIRYGFSSFLGPASGNASVAYGVYSGVSGSATTGPSYAGYFTSPANTPGQWSVYAIGDSYFSSDVRIATTTQATGYELSVDGQIMCEDITVLDSGLWPDYVFDEDYPLRSLADVESHIKKEGHLPGVPSAEEMERNGIEMAQTQKTIMEKIEELTLYAIEQEKRLDAQAQEIERLKKMLSDR